MHIVDWGVDLLELLQRTPGALNGVKPDKIGQQYAKHDV